jgi:hypothetical protein
MLTMVRPANTGTMRFPVQARRRSSAAGSAAATRGGGAPSSYIELEAICFSNQWCAYGSSLKGATST